MSVKQCPLKCTHAFQDATYGKNMRVHTVGKLGDERCTICSGPARWVHRLKLHAQQFIDFAPYDPRPRPTK